MIKNLDDYLVGIALGIRFRQNYSIEDKFGIISDMILYSDGSFFGPNIFPRRQKFQPEKLILFNESTDDKLIFDHENIILEINFVEESQISKDNLNEILNSFDEQFIKGVLKELSISKIVRIGYIRKYLFRDEELIKSFLKRTPGERISNIRDISLRFSKRIGTVESLVNKNNYDNVIYTITKNAEQDNELNIAIDYQTFYEPNLSTSSQIKFNKFVGDINYYNSKIFLSWLNDYFEESSDEVEENKEI
jgi:hypothetical protein